MNPMEKIATAGVPDVRGAHTHYGQPCDCPVGFDHGDLLDDLMSLEQINDDSDIYPRWLWGQRVLRDPGPEAQALREAGKP